MKTMLLSIGLILGLFTIATEAKTETKVIEMKVTDKGFEPSQITVMPGTSVTLKVTRLTDSTCATQIQVPSKKLKKDLPLNQTVEVTLGVLEKGEISFGCGMNMMGGQIIVQ